MLILNLPYLPAKELSPNWKPYTPGAMWVHKGVRDELSSRIYWLTLEAMEKAGITAHPAFERIQITYTFIVPTNRRRDGDNWIARMKPAQDALVKAGVVSDDTHEHVAVMPPRFVVEKGRRETIIEIEEMG